MKIEKKNNIKNFINNNLILILSNIFILIYSFISYFNIKYKLDKLNVSSINCYIYFSIILLILLVFFNIFYIKKLNKIDNKSNKDQNLYSKLFLLIVIFLGGFYLILSPFYTGSDEHNHFYRIFEIIEGNLVTPTDEYVGSMLSSSLKDVFVEGGGKNTSIKYRDIKNMIKIKYDSENLIQYGVDSATDYSNTALYSPVQYIPHLIGVSIGKILNLNVYYIGMLGRLFNFICYAILGYLALKLIPKHKIFYLAILLSPNMIQSATTLSADAFTGVIFLLIIALIYKIKTENKVINRKTLLILGLLCVIISFCKIVYFPVVFLLLLINKDCFKNGKKEKYLYSIFIIFISCFASLYWATLTDGVFRIAYDMNTSQKNFIFNNIFEYLAVFLRTISNYYAVFLESLFVGVRMYHSQLKMPSLVSWLYVYITFALLFTSKENNDLKNIERLFIAFISIIIIGLICTALYVQYTAKFISVGNATIEGIQGRYFLPVVMLLPLIVKNKINLKISEKFVMSMITAINIITILYICVQFI